MHEGARLRPRTLFTKAGGQRWALLQLELRHAALLSLGGMTGEAGGLLGVRTTHDPYQGLQ